MHKWQTRPAIHLNSSAGLQNCFLTAVFFKSHVSLVNPSCEGAVRSNSSLCEGGSNITWDAKLTLPLTTSKFSRSQTEQMQHPVTPADFSSSQNTQLVQVIFILQLPSKPSKDSLPHTYTSHTCSNSWYQPPTDLLPICRLSFPRKAATSFPVPHIRACAESNPNTVLAGWVN